jgi:hypothetical protein
MSLFLRLVPLGTNLLKRWKNKTIIAATIIKNAPKATFLEEQKIAVVSHMDCVASTIERIDDNEFVTSTVSAINVGSEPAQEC